jgi:two-component system chemotaxis response regulator CheY
MPNQLHSTFAPYCGGPESEWNTRQVGNEHGWFKFMRAASISILVVDDFATMRKMIRAALRGLAGVKIIEADSAFLAWSLLQKSHYDLLLTDWVMPEMSGLELVQRVRAHPALAHMRILMISSEGESDKQAIARQLGVDGFLSKPFSAHALNEEIRRLFGIA